VWSDNILVKTLYNFHCLEILDVWMGVLQKKRDDKGKRERRKTEMPCSAQTRD
jgi:hypothetical protein